MKPKATSVSIVISGGTPILIQADKWLKMWMTFTTLDIQVAGPGTNPPVECAIVVAG